jgi:Flp pilus assembly protein TadD
MAYHALERPEAAAGAFAKALALHPSHPVALNSFGVLLMDLGDLARAEQFFRDALMVLPEHPAARANLEALLEQRSSSSDAVGEALTAKLADELDDV